jgi:hypothetical protein
MKPSRRGSATHLTATRAASVKGTSWARKSDSLREILDSLRSFLSLTLHEPLLHELLNQVGQILAELLFFHLIFS